jgi:hypothetical protein
MSTTTTAKGIVLPNGDDPRANGDDLIRGFGNWVDARPGVAIHTTAQRDALSGVDRWTGKVIWNSDRKVLEAWDGTVWVEAGGGGGYARHLMLMGA